MAIWVTKYFFNSSQADNGFSEVYYQDAADYTVARDQAESLLNIRLGMMPPEVQCIYASVSQATVPGDAHLVILPYPLEGLFPDADGAEPLSTGLLVRQETAEGLHGMRILRGLPESVVVRENYEPVEGWEAAFNAWVELLSGVASPWKFRHVQDDVVFYLEILNIINRARITHRDAGRPFGTRLGRRTGP